MTTTHNDALTHAPEAIRRWVAADRRTDLAAMRNQLASDVSLVSPLTDAFRFRGPTEVTQVFAAAFDLLSDIEIYRVTGSGRDWVVYGKNRIAGANLEEIQWLHLNEADEIAEITLFIRPAAAVLTLFSRIGSRMVARGIMPKISGIGAASLSPIALVLRMIERHVMASMGPYSSR